MNSGLEIPTALHKSGASLGLSGGPTAGFPRSTQPGDTTYMASEVRFFLAPLID